MQKKLSKLISILLCAVMVLGIMPVTGFAANPTSITIADASGNDTQIIISDGVANPSSGTNWSYDLASNKLTLDGWSGQKIFANDGFNLHLTGTNTIDMATDGTYGINVKNGSGTVTITGDTDATLTINGSNLTQTAKGIDGGLKLYSGEVSINMTTSTDNTYIYGVSSSYMYLYNESKLNINITKDSTGRIYTIGSGSGYPQVNGSATLNVTVDGKNKSYVSSYNAVEITDGASKVRIEYNNLYGDMPTFSASLGKLAEGGYYEVIGAKAQFRSYAVPLWSTNKITTPTSDVKFKAQEISYSIFTDVLDSSDQPVTHIKVEGQSEKVDFSLIDSEVTLPDMKVGNKIAKYYIAEGLLGAHSNEVTCKIDYTKFPKGLNATDYSTGNGYIYGTPTAPAEAGEIIVTFTDKNDPSRTATKTIKWNAIADKDYYMTVDDTTFIMNETKSGSGWEWNPSDGGKLTLNGYAGEKISAEKSFNLHLTGTNTINMTTNGTYGINAKNSTVTVTGDTNATLTINGTNLTQTAMGIYGGLKLYSGEVSINMTSSTDNADIYGVSSSYVYIENNSKLNINITKDSTGKIYTIGNGSGYPVIENNATLNITVDGKNKSSISSYNALEINPGANGATKIKIEYKNLDGEMPTFSTYFFDPLADGGYYEVIGAKAQFKSYVAPLWSTNKITTPTDGVKFKTQESGSSIFVDVLDSSNQPVTHIKVEGQSEKVALSLADTDVTLPDIKVGEQMKKYYICDGLQGVFSGEVAYSVSGTLPTGLRIDNNAYLPGNSYITGIPSIPADAGQITVTITDKTDASRAITKTIKWNEIKSPKPVTDVIVDKTIVTLAPNGTATIEASVKPDDATYPILSVTSSNNAIATAKVSTPDSNGKSAITVTAVSTGSATLTVTSLDTDIKKTVTVYVREITPTATIDYVAEELKGLVASAKYLIDGTEYTADANGKIAIVSDLLGNTVDIIKMGATAETNSAPQSLVIPARPATPTATIENASVPEKADGKLNNVDSSMEYRLKGSDSWTPIYNSPVAVGIGEYEIRVRATNSNFVSESQLVTVAANHKHTIVKVLPKMSTCTEYGWTSIHYKCSECGQLFFDEAATMPIDYAPGRIAPTHDLISATCTEPMKCQNCDYTEGTALGHDLTDVSAKAATCTEDGHKAYKKCSRCDYTEGFEKIKALGHKIVDVPGKAATCTEKGLSDGKKCSVCGEITLGQVETPTIGHDYTEVITKPTCTEGGFTTRTCKNCGHVVKDDETPARGHTPSDWLVKTEAKIGVKGEEIKKCTVCGVELESREIPAIEKPTEPTTKPTEPTTKPTEPTTKPTEPTTKPTEPTTKPTEPTEKPTDPIANFLLGDVNGDGLVKANDARTALRAAAKLEELDERALKAADIDGNGKVSAAEARKILRFAAKLDKELK